jgi:hypothetical protein
LQAKMLLDRGKEATDEFLEAETAAIGERIKSEMTMSKEEKAKSKESSPTLIERFAEEGYECERGTPPSNAEKGRDEGGQDISNIPDLSPEEHQRRAPCFRSYMESLPREERGIEQQRITREANEKGVTTYEIVGC